MFQIANAAQDHGRQGKVNASEPSKCSVDQCWYRVISDQSRKVLSSFHFCLPGQAENGEKNQKSGMLVIMCMQACHMDPVEVIAWSQCNLGREVC